MKHKQIAPSPKSAQPIQLLEAPNKPEEIGKAVEIMAKHAIEANEIRLQIQQKREDICVLDARLANIRDSYAQHKPKMLGLLAVLE